MIATLLIRMKIISMVICISPSEFNMWKPKIFSQLWRNWQDSVSQSIKKAQAAKVTFQPGDRIEVLNGEQRGSKGIVTRTTKDIATIKLNGFTTPLEFPISTLRKIFEPGDHVTVINGEHQGDAGLVLMVEQGQVTFMSTQTSREVTIRTKPASP